MSDDKKDQFLPPRPGEKEVTAEIKGVPFSLYIHGQKLDVSKSTALDIMAQIVSILTYFDSLENK